MKNLKMVLSITSTVMMMVLISACGPKSDPVKDFSVEPVDGGKGIRITGYVGAKTEVSIPSKIQKLPVTHIGKKAFGEKKLTKVTIPNSVIEIEGAAFRGNQLTSVNIPDSVIKIGNYAFHGNKLTNINIPNSVTEIESDAFSSNQLTSIDIPNSITEIGLSVFSYNKLISLTIPNNVTRILGKPFENGAFANNQLTSIIIPDSVKEIGNNIFINNELTSITIGENVDIKIDYFSDYPTFDDGFGEFYTRNRKAAGTYTRADINTRTWTKQ